MTGTTNFDINLDLALKFYLDVLNLLLYWLVGDSSSSSALSGFFNVGNSSMLASGSSASGDFTTVQ